MSLDVSIFSSALPEIFVFSMVGIVLLIDIFLGKRFRSLTYLVSQLTLVIAFAFTICQFGDYRTVAFDGLFVTDDIAVLLKSFIYICVIFAFIYARNYNEERQIARGEYYILGLFSVLGMMVLVSANALLTIYLGLELMSLPMYAMVALNRKDRKASEAAMKYFIMGAVASGMLLYGMSMLYGITGSMDISIIETRIGEVLSQQPLMVSFAVVFLVVGVSFKLALVPFHMWAPDVYQGAPSSMTMFLSSAPKIAAIGMAIRLLVFAMAMVQALWQELFIIVAILSVVLGNVFAMAQTNIKRMLAYSGVAHMGFVLFGLIAGNSEGYAASLYYILVYGVMSVAGFALVVMLSKQGFEAELISDLKGLNQKSPWLAFMMLVVMFSMAGVPPTVGFFTKFLVLKALISAGFLTLAIIALLFAVVGAFYYIRIVKTMYFDAPDEAVNFACRKELVLVFSINALALLLAGLFPNALISACLQAFAR